MYFSRYFSHDLSSCEVAHRLGNCDLLPAPAQSTWAHSSPMAYCSPVTTHLDRAEQRNQRGRDTDSRAASSHAFSETPPLNY